MRNTYRISIIHQIKHLWVIFYYFLVIVLGSLFISLRRYGYIDYEKTLLISLIILLIFLVPQFILHINYYTKNKGFILVCDLVNQDITISHKGKSVSFSFSDIELIKRYKSYPLAENRMHWFPWDSYNYSIIRLRNGQEVILTSLLVLNLDLPIEPKKVKLIKTFYPIIYT